MKEIIRAAFVIARRDFTAIIFSKAFFFFLAGPLFPLIIALLAGGLGAQTAKNIDRPVIGVALSDNDFARVEIARKQLAQKIGGSGLPEFVTVVDFDPANPKAALDRHDPPLTALWAGSLAAPRLIGTKGDVERWRGEVQLIAESALSQGRAVTVEPDILAATASNKQRSRYATAQAGQVLLILLTMILAGMVLSNLVEEKTNKIIEILAAAVPMDAIFLGKLFAMLGMALVGIAVWASLGFAGFILFSGGTIPALPAPAVGWPAFVVLLVLYFCTAYLLLGSLFLGIGSLATTVREVQTLSMPVTMGQLLVFFLASYAVTEMGRPIEWLAVLIPFSSPFAMIARAAQSPNLWQHGLALLWQAAFVLVIIRFGVTIFRRNVMKTGRGGRRGLIAALRG